VRTLTLAVVLHLLLGGLSGEKFALFQSQPQVTLIPYNPTGLPVNINSAVADNSGIESWLEYSMSNVSTENMAGVYVRVFVVDATGKLLRIEDGFSGEAINGGATLRARVRIRGTVETGLSFTAVTRVVGSSGVWQVDPSALESVIKAKISGQPGRIIKANFEPHLTIGNEDRIRIFKLLVEDIIRDNQKAEKLSDCTNIIILRKDLNFELPLIPDVKLSALDHAEIQIIADEKGKVIYLIYEPFVVEGSHVLARMALRDKVTRRPGMHVPFGYTFLYTLAKKDHQWMIEKSIGYAQSVGYSQ
jgi:hypothetical protein